MGGASPLEDETSLAEDADAPSVATVAVESYEAIKE